MFNLLMTGQDGAWNGEPITLDRVRFCEYTADAVKARFQSLQGDSLSELLSFPALFAYEDYCKSDAQIGRIILVRHRANELRIEYQIAPSLPSITARDIEHLVWELDIAGWELNRTHWAVKDVNLFAELIKAGLITQAQLNVSPEFPGVNQDVQEAAPPVPIQPSVFRIPETGMEPDLVSVMLPFQSNFHPVFQTLQDACSQLGLRCLNANLVWDENEIIQDIFSLIYHSKVVICDFSGRNPNVFYEAGIAHTLGRDVIPIVQNSEHIPFDLRHHRYIEYLNNSEGLGNLCQGVVPRLQTLMQK